MREGGRYRRCSNGVKSGGVQPRYEKRQGVDPKATEAERVRPAKQLTERNWTEAAAEAVVAFVGRKFVAAKPERPEDAQPEHAAQDP